MRLTLLLALTCFATLQAADPSQPLYWSASQLKDVDKKASAKLNPERHLGTERLLDSAFVAFRNGSGEAELHEKLADLIIVRSGEGAVLIGGKMIDGKPSGPDEVRGKASKARRNIRSRPETRCTFPLTRRISSGWSRVKALRRWWRRSRRSRSCSVLKICP